MILAAADFDPVLVVVVFAVFRFVLVIWTSGLGWLAPSRHRHSFRPRRICRLGPWAAGGSRVLGSAISMHASFAGEVQWKPTVFSRNHSAIDVCNPVVGPSLAAFSGWAARSVARSPRYPWSPRRDSQSRRRRPWYCNVGCGGRICSRTYRPGTQKSRLRLVSEARNHLHRSTSSWIRDRAYVF